MKKFDFRLQKVLEFREMSEGWAKEAYLDARAKRLEGEAVILGIQERRTKALAETVLDIQDHRLIERLMINLDDEERSQKAALQVLLDEEAKTLSEWQETKREVETLAKLKAKELAEYGLEVAREEQKELDEWATQRKVA